MKRTALVTRRFVWLGLVMVLAAACATSAQMRTAAAPVETPSAPPPVDVPEINWNNPIDGEPVPSLPAAQALVPFGIYEPKNVPSPTTLLVGPIGARQPDLVVAFLYDIEPYGRVVVKEHVPDVPVDEYVSSNREMLNLNGQSNVHGSFEVATIRGDREALITTSEDRTTSSIFWLEGAIEIVIRGPSLDRDAVIKLAESI